MQRTGRTNCCVHVPHLLVQQLRQGSLLHSRQQLKQQVEALAPVGRRHVPRNKSERLDQ